MSEETDSAIERTVVFVRLLGEGTTVYRPVPADRSGPRSAYLVAPPDYDPETEEWEFPPGSHVRISSTETDRRIIATSALDEGPAQVSSPEGSGDEPRRGDR